VLWLAAPFRFVSPCAGFEPFVPVRGSELPRFGFDCFSAKGPISDPFHQPCAALAFHPEDSLFDVVVEAADAMPKRSGLSPAFVILEYFYDKVEPWVHGSNPAHGDTKRKGAASQSAEVFALPIGTVWVAQRFYRSAYRQLSHKLTDCL